MQSADEMDISAARGVAVREFPLKTGFADYLLYADAKALGTIEAKPKGHTLTGVETQSAKYSAGLGGLPHFHLPLPFAYELTGSVTQFTSLLDPYARTREIFTFHRPEELIRLATLESQLRCNLCKMPEVAVECSPRNQAFAHRVVRSITDWAESKQRYRFWSGARHSLSPLGLCCCLLQ